MKESISVMARDGVKISATWFLTDNPHEKVVLINSATGVKQSYYSDFATYLTKQGFNVYTFDYRGIGDSCATEKAYLQCDMKDWAKDVDAMIGHITRVHQQARLVVIGHSVGGQLIGMSRLGGYADALVMVGAQTPFWKNFGGGFTRVKLLLFWYFLIPVLTKIFGYFPASKLRLFEDLPANVALQWARWAKASDYVFKENPELKSSFDLLDQRTLFVSVSDDELAPHKAVLDLKRFFTRVQAEHWHIHPEDILLTKIGHFGFFRKQMEIVLWQDTVRWIERSLPVQKYKAA
jgi:predicted alpha/beta hydrolase